MNYNSHISQTNWWHYHKCVHQSGTGMHLAWFAYEKYCIFLAFSLFDSPHWLTYWKFVKFRRNGQYPLRAFRVFVNHSNWVVNKPFTQPHNFLDWSRPALFYSVFAVVFVFIHTIIHHWLHQGQCWIKCPAQGQLNMRTVRAGIKPPLPYSLSYNCLYHTFFAALIAVLFLFV